MSHSGIYPLVGESVDPKIVAFELRIYDFVNKIDFGSVLPAFDPAYYYITSGDAIHKAKYMRDVLGEYLEKTVNKKHIAAIKKAIKQTNNLINNLEVSRGPSCFLETDRKDNMLIVVAKNPRPR